MKLAIGDENISGQYLLPSLYLTVIRDKKTRTTSKCFAQIKANILNWKHHFISYWSTTWIDCSVAQTPYLEISSRKALHELWKKTSYPDRKRKLQPSKQYLLQNTLRRKYEEKDDFCDSSYFSVKWAQIWIGTKDSALLNWQCY